MCTMILLEGRLMSGRLDDVCRPVEYGQENIWMNRVRMSLLVSYFARHLHNCDGS